MLRKGAGRDITMMHYANLDVVNVEILDYRYVSVRFQKCMASSVLNRSILILSANYLDLIFLHL